MKTSRYNFIFPLETDLYLIYNALSGGFAKVDSQVINVLKEIEKGENVKPYNSQDPLLIDAVENLEKGRFIWQDDSDERAYLKVLTNMHRFGSRSLGLTIAPTLECNFACIYCYEEHEKIRMNAEIVSAVKKFLENELKQVNGLGITWFGGEPLLTLDIMKDITHTISEVQKKKELHFEAGLITNGYLLDKKAAEVLLGLQVKTVQITVDGPEDVHDTRRPLRNGKGTFQKIIDNIVKVSDILKGISVRVNVDKLNIERAPELLDTLKAQGLKEKVGVYFAPVQAVGSRCKDVSAECFDYETYSTHEIELYRKALEKGFEVVRYPKPFRGYCGAVSLHALLIDPHGNLHKCWNTVGVEEEKVGKIGEPLKMDPILVKWLSWDPFEKKECGECKFLPICMGGCPYFLRTREMNCNSWKYNLEQMLRLYYVSKLNQNAEI